MLTDPRTRPENAGPDPCVRTISTPAENADNVIVSPDLDKHNIDKDFLPVGLGEHTGSPLLPVNLGDHTTSPLHKIIQWFKTMATNEYIRNVKMNDWEPFNGKLFQRDYYEHIIRNEIAYNNIAAYVKDNPANWDSNNLNAD